MNWTTFVGPSSTDKLVSGQRRFTNEDLSLCIHKSSSYFKVTYRKKDKNFIFENNTIPCLPNRPKDTKRSHFPHDSPALSNKRSPPPHKHILCRERGKEQPTAVLLMHSGEYDDLLSPHILGIKSTYRREHILFFIVDVESKSFPKSACHTKKHNFDNNKCCNYLP